MAGDAVPERLGGRGGTTRRRLPGRATLAALAAAAAAAALTGGPSAAQAADACPNAEARTQQHAAFLPDCRGYEIVSPLDKQGGSVKYDPVELWGATAFNAAGDKALYLSYFSFADAQGVTISAYRAQRDAQGWTSKVASPNPAVDATAFNNNVTPADASEDLDTIVMSTIGFMSPLDTQPFTNDVYLRTGTGPVELVSRGNAADGPMAQNAQYAGMSGDGKHILFEADRDLVPVATGPAQAAGQTLYDRVGGVTKVVALDGAGALQSQCGSVLAAPRYSATINDPISPDGSRIAYVTPDPSGFGDPSCSDPRRLWLRVGDHTVEVSRSRIGGDPALTQPTFAGMSRDGNVVYFTAVQKLTADGSADHGLYRYETSSDSLTYVTDDVAKVLGVSDDGEVIYYQSDTDDSLGYVDHGAVHAAATPPMVDLYGAFPVWAAAPDGSSLLFMSTMQMTSYDPHATFEVYRLDGHTGDLRCLSCPPDGRPPVGEGRLSRATQGVATSPAIRIRNALPGGRAVFDSPERLTDDDTDSSNDVYLYDADGLHLISPGVGPEPSYYAGASADGDDIFFATTAGLIAQDTDDANDLYDARVDGGVASRDAVVPCAGDVCQGPLAPTPGASTPGSALFAGSDSAPIVRSGTASTALKITKPKAVRGTSTRLTVKVPQKGTLRLSGSGVLASSAAPKTAGTVHLTVRLSQRAKRTLARKHRLRVAVTVRFAPAKGSSSTVRVSVTFTTKTPAISTAKRSVRRTAVLSSDARKGR